MKPEQQQQQQRQPEYVLGHNETELARLILQGQYCERQTRMHLVMAGLSQGMRVLDFGCGVGDVTFLAASLVGPSGHVIGIDRSPEALQMARARAEGLGLRQVEFQLLDDTQLEGRFPAASFDAVIGRLVLIYQAAPAACLRRLATYLRPGGFAMFEEPQLANGWYGAHPPIPTLSKFWWWLSEVSARAGIELNMGTKLRQTFLDAGFAEPEVLLTSRIAGGAESMAYKYLAEIIRSLLPAIQRFGIATAEEVDIDTLAARIRDEVVAGGGAIAPSMMVAGTGRWPGPTA